MLQERPRMGRNDEYLPTSPQRRASFEEAAELPLVLGAIQQQNVRRRCVTNAILGVIAPLDRRWLGAVVIEWPIEPR
jgi:hypothetical protein